MEYRRELIKILKWSEFFKTFSDDELEIISKYFIQKMYASGEEIIKEGTKGKNMGIIINGTAKVTINENDEERKLSEIKEGEIMGELALLANVPRTASVIACDRVITATINTEDLLSMIDEHPKLGARFILQVCKSMAFRFIEADTKIKNLLL